MERFVSFGMPKSSNIMYNYSCLSNPSTYRTFVLDHDLYSFVVGYSCVDFETKNGYNILKHTTVEKIASVLVEV